MVRRYKRTSKPKPQFEVSTRDRWVCEACGFRTSAYGEYKDHRCTQGQKDAS